MKCLCLMWFAIVAPVTSLDVPSTPMSPLDWLVYGSVVILLGAVSVAAILLIARLVKALFGRSPR